MRNSGKGQKVIAFGDFSNYWMVQRFPMTIRTLKEKFAMEAFRKAQAEIEKKNEKPMSQKMFKVI